MKSKHSWMIAATGLLAIGMAATALMAQSTPSTPLQPAKTTDKADAPKAAAKDVIIFKNGNRIECQIVEETDTTVKVKVSHAGMNAETVYQKSDILAIQKGGGAAMDGTAKDAKPEVKKDGKKVDPKDVKHEDGAPTVYVVKCAGEFGRSPAIRHGG